MILYKLLVPIVRIIINVLFKVELNNWESIPKEDGLIICANHWSNWDPFFISVFFPQEIHWMAKKELFKNPILKFLLKKCRSF